jgi:hypothetical protein
VDANDPFLELIIEFIPSIAKKCFPSMREDDSACGDVPIPQTGAATLESKGPALIGARLRLRPVLSGLSLSHDGSTYGERICPRAMTYIMIDMMGRLSLPG